MKLSIIVPIYNVEKYISRCALSLYNQTAHKEDYEIIFVNDGTKDNSILNLRKTLDFVHTPNIFIVDKPNGGLSSARNYGLRHSRGEYVWFVDSDDWVDSDSVEVLLNLINQSPDVIATTQMYSNIGDNQTYKYPHSINFEGKGADLLKYYPPVCSVAYICKRSFLYNNHLEFKEGILHEDAELIPRLIYLANNIVATDRPLYHHFMRENSITQTINPHRYESYFVVLMVLTHYDDDHIGGVLAYIKKHKADRPFPVKHMWVNCAYDIPIYSSPNISFGQAKKLANELKEINECLVKEGFSIIDWETPIVAKKESIKLPFADILILSPNAGTKDINDKNYMNAIHNANIGREYYTRQKQALKNSLSELALVKKRQPKENDIQEVINWSSIAFVVRSDNFSMLMLGDSYPCSIVESLKNVGYSTDNPLYVDYVKISHHGSRNNISNELLDMIDCDRFLISTNGGNGTSCHPDRETIANIACHAKRDRNKSIHLYFNYPIRKIENVGYKFIEEKELEHYNIVVHEDVQQITKELP